MNWPEDSAQRPRAVASAPDGHCEVKPEMRCVWVKAVERAPKTPWAEDIHDIRQPVDNRLWGTSSWVNHFTKRDKVRAQGVGVSRLEEAIAARRVRAHRRAVDREQRRDARECMSSSRRTRTTSTL